MRKRMLSIWLCLMMVMSILPTVSFAAESDTAPEGEATTTAPEGGATIYVDAVNGNDTQEDVGTTAEKAYKTLATAVTKAASGDIIMLGKGNYTLYDKNSKGQDSAQYTKNKDLTFVGQGTDETKWGIGAEVPDPANFGTEFNGDYCFNGAGTITFQNMTLQSGSVDYLGFIRADNTVVENCTINGKTFYWGYKSAMFKNTTFNCPSGDYALWTYCSPVMTFDSCTFNSSGKVINVYNENSAADYTINFNNCTVNSSNPNSLSVMNINDKLVEGFTINFTGTNKVTGIKADGIQSTDGSHASPAKGTENGKKTSEQATCSKLFEFNMKYGNGNTGKTTVNIDEKPVWQGGKMVSHAIDTDNDKYTDGYKDNAFTDPIYSEWTKNPDGSQSREVTKTCKYCGYEETYTETKEADPIDWDVSKSKTATKLDTSTWTSNVTLSLPSAEENLASDVVLVLDASKCAKDMLEATIKLLEKLEEQVDTGANIKVGIVMFKGNAVPFQTLTKAADLKDLRTTLANLIQEDDTDGSKTKSAVRAYVAATYPEFMNGGTNIPAGLQLAKNMLEGDTTVADARKYMVLVSDGDTYLFCHETANGDYDYTKSYTRAGPSKSYIGGVSEYENYDTNVPVRDKYLKAQNSLDAKLWQDYLDYVGTHNQNFTQYDFQASADAFNAGKFPDGFTDDLLIPSNVTDRIINSDVSRYQTASLYTELQDKYNCYYCFLPGGYDQARTMLQAFTPADRLIDGTTTGTNIFSGITKDILYAVGAGSKVTDTIGDKFTFGGVDSFVLTVGGSKIEGTPDAADANTVNFGEVKNDGTYPYTITYTPATKTFVWTINENVSNFAPVQLTYTVKLTTPETDPGTYGVEDLKGEKELSDAEEEKALFTNESAVLNAINSAGAQLKPLDFPKPSVSYTVKKSSSGGGGGGGHKPTVTIPDDVPTGLNGDDHYAYIVGYPDSTVRPQNGITRAEVATIFFRLLTDETRNANSTKSNSYSDVAAGAWYNHAVSTLSAMGIVKGDSHGKFNPNAPITRAEFAAIAARFDDKADTTAVDFSDIASHWAKDEISAAANNGWINGYTDGTFRPNNKITRAEAMTLVNRVLKRLPETAEDLHNDMIKWSDNSDTSAWYYLAVQEATNSHYYDLKENKHEKWSKLRETRDWTELEK